MARSHKNILHTKEFFLIVLGFITVLILIALSFCLYCDDSRMINKMIRDDSGVRIVKNGSSTDSIYKIYRDDATFIPLSGYRWQMATTSSSLLSYDELMEFPKEYHDKLINNGWVVNEARINGTRLYAPTGRGTNGIMWGYFKVHDNYLYTLSIEGYFNAAGGFETINGSSTPIGPYLYTFRIFSADPVPLSRI